MAQIKIWYTARHDDRCTVVLPEVDDVFLFVSAARNRGGVFLPGFGSNINFIPWHSISHFEAVPDPPPAKDSDIVTEWKNLTGQD